ncbi:hypothetical protein AB0I39_22425 [Kitasatospora purpeofusca]|uniref:hypothetical protein n=1 Tax=Kitasatospora purpeofusca TaxID=67352 RepID=UPI0033EF8C4A
MTLTRRIAAAGFLAATLLPLAAAPASAAPAVQSRYIPPPVTTEDCEEGGGFIFLNIVDRKLVCVLGEYNNHLISD